YGHFAWFLHTRWSYETDEASAHEEAERYYKKALEVDPEHARSLGDYAYFLYVHRRDFAEARRLFERCLQVDPTYKQGIVDYAKFLESLGETEKAEELRRRARSVKGLVITFAGGVAADMSKSPEWQKKGA